jgi:Bacterial extracellular solute-binding protein, family 7
MIMFNISGHFGICSTRLKDRFPVQDLMSPLMTPIPSQNGGKVVACRFPERRVSTTDELIEVAVENACSGLEQQVSAARGPPHGLTLVEAFVHDLIDRGLTSVALYRAHIKQTL